MKIKEKASPQNSTPLTKKKSTNGWSGRVFPTLNLNENAFVEYIMLVSLIHFQEYD